MDIEQSIFLFWRKNYAIGMVGLSICASVFTLYFTITSKIGFAILMYAIFLDSFYKK